MSSAAQEGDRRYNATTLRVYARDVAEAFDGLGCVRVREFRRWAMQARVAQPQSATEILTLFCGDCTQEYRLASEAEGTCNRPPGGWQEQQPPQQQ